MSSIIWRARCFVDSVAESLEVTHVKYLTTNVEMKTQELDVLHFGSLLDDALHVAHGDTKLVFCQARSDVGMCMRTYIRVDAEAHLGNLVLLLGEFVDDFQLRDALYIEAEDALVQTEVRTSVCANVFSVSRWRLPSTYYRKVWGRVRLCLLSGC